jgi:hypothetical protein
MKENTLKYQNQKKEKQGKEISYESIEMAENLLPYNKIVHQPKMKNV